MAESKKAKRLRSFFGSDLRVVALMQLVLLLTLLTSSPGAAGDGELLAVEEIMLPGGRVQLNIATDGEVPDPKVFRTSQPDRIILDFFGVKSSVRSRIREIKRGSLDSVIVVANEEKSRVIIDLIAAVPFEIRKETDGLILLIDQVLAGQQAVTQRAGLVPVEGLKTVSDPHKVTALDFRRGPGGSGRVMIELDREDAGITVSEQHGEIVIDLADAVLNEELERRLDVIDFATPVHFTDAFSLDNRT